MSLKSIRKALLKEFGHKLDLFFIKGANGEKDRYIEAVVLKEVEIRDIAEWKQNVQAHFLPSKKIDKFMDKISILIDKVSKKLDKHIGK